MIKGNSQMEQWSILSDNIVYVKSEDNDIMNGIDIKSIDYRDYKRMYELVFGRKPKLLLDLETNPDIKVVATYKEYYERLEQRLKYLQKVLLDFKMRLVLLNKDWEYFQYNSEDLVYLISPLTSQLRTASRKIMVKYVGTFGNI